MNPTRSFFHLFYLLLYAAVCFFSSSAHAISLIRDAEIEDTLRAYGNPIFKEAGLNPKAVHLFIVNDSSINAYVAGGQNMFIHTGLILKTDTPNMLIGVMAHETGHMAGGHLAQGTEQLKNAQMGAIISAVLGAAMVAGGGGEEGMAVMSAGQQVAMRNYLHFSRGNESAADQAALDYLDQLGISASGMLRMMEILRQDENRSYGSPDPYTRTHPLNIDRITHIRDHVMHSTIREDFEPAGFNERHARMIAKLSGFIDPPEQTLNTYPKTDHSVPARYARAIAYYRLPDLPQALAEIDSLIKESPKDPFFHELRGQILFENGRVAEALQSYARAATLLPNSPLILTDYGKVLLANQSKDNLAKAIHVLEHANILDSADPNTWHQLAQAYAQAGNMGKFYLASAEESSLEDNPGEVIRNVNLALKNLGNDRTAKLRANDLRLYAEKERQEHKEDGSQFHLSAGHG
ncbi:MAG TPA: M48 family metalloprotease [Rickettsiales bacterium]|nr:M48 family metalloprotease [Rickettsiales bacterium]